MAEKQAWHALYQAVLLLKKSEVLAVEPQVILTFMDKLLLIARLKEPSGEGS